MQEKDEISLPIIRITGQLSNMVRRLLNQTFSDFLYSGAETGCISFIVGETNENPGKNIFQKDIEKEFNFRSPTASEILKKLEEKGLIKRESLENDARKKKLIPTQEAYKYYTQIKQMQTEMEQKIILGISQTEIDAFKNTSRKMIENMKIAIQK